MTWIRITDDPDSLPEVDTAVWLHMDGEIMPGCRRSERLPPIAGDWKWRALHGTPEFERGRWTFDFDGAILNPTHWQPLPEPPRE